MTLFEYVAVAASLIASFAAVRLLGGIAPALRPESRYWVHAAWLFMMVFLLSIQWWLFWAYHDVEWDYGRFILALSPLCILYVQSSLLIPADTARIESWRVHYYEVRVRTFGLALAMLAAMVLCTVVLFDHPLVHPRRVLPGSLGLLFATGLVSDNPKLHATITIAVSVMTVIAAVTFMRAGAFGVAP